jgi:hypothetical protein
MPSAPLAAMIGGTRPTTEPSFSVPAIKVAA